MLELNGERIAILIALALLFGVDKFLGHKNAEKDTQARITRRKAGRW